MVKFTHKFTGCTMWVAEDKVEEFKAAGHKLAAAAPAPEVSPKKVTKKGKTKK